jgi:superoxide reductase
MAKRNQVFQCEKCGSMVVALKDSQCDPACCGQPMKALSENTTDAAKEKHVPVIVKTPEGYKVSVGAVAHPMEADHYIEWIELIADGIAYRQYLKPGEKPEATFCVQAGTVSAREFCNKHGLWKA